MPHVRPALLRALGVLASASAVVAVGGTTPASAAVVASPVVTTGPTAARFVEQVGAAPGAVAGAPVVVDPAVTVSDAAAAFFSRRGFVEVGPDAVPSAKWEGYDAARRRSARTFLRAVADDGEQGRLGF